MSNRTPVPWIDQARLRLALPGEVVALYDGDRKLEAGQFVIDEGAGAIFFMAQPESEITAVLKHEAPAGRVGTRNDKDA